MKKTFSSRHGSKPAAEIDREDNLFMAACRYFGSLKLAIPLIIILAALLIFGTFFESLKSTELAQRFIYASWWFDFYLCIFALNVFCAVVTRFPFQKRHTGFIVTHAGILIICLGSALNRHFGVEGQMYLHEGSSADEITMSEPVLEVQLPDHLAFEISVDPFHLRSLLNKTVRLGQSDYLITILDRRERMVPRTAVEEAQGGDRNPAIQFELASEMAGFQQEQWLVYFDATDPNSGSWSLGPATFRLFKALSEEEQEYLLKSSVPEENKSEPELIVTLPAAQEPVRLSIHPDKLDTFEIKPLNARLNILEYLPSARVVDNKLVNAPEAEPNPAVRLEILGPDGKRERHTVFALFPDFDTLHGGEDSGWSGVKLQLKTPSAGATENAAQFTFVQGVDEQLRFASETKRGGYTRGLVELGAWQGAGWMDFKFRVNKYISSAHVTHELVPVEESAQGEGMKAQESQAVNGILVKIVKIGMQRESSAPQEPVWISFGSEKAYSLGNEDVVLRYRYRAKPVSFSVKLVDFRRIFYPGTSNAAAYESDVVLHDHAEGLTREQKIYMNHPLDYKGYRVFQSSFVEVQPGEPEISVFTVAKAPGTPIIYVGSIVMILGISIMFYIRPFSSANIPNAVLPK